MKSGDTEALGGARLDLKLGFGVTQGHRKWHYLIEHIRLYIYNVYVYLCI